MDGIHNLLNIILPPISLLLLILILPPFLFFKFLYFLFKSFTYKEDVTGKVVLITGASSGIGQHLAYEYARRRACLVLVARREKRLQVVADEARKLGSPDVIIISADVSVFDECKRFVEQTINHFGRLDHLVNNAGKAPACFFEEYERVTDHVSVMNVNFWGSVYSTQFAVQHLRKSKGKIIVIASWGGYIPTPALGIYCATKAAQINFFDTLRMELSPDIGITIVTPSLTESEITQKEFLSKINVQGIPLVSTERCAKAIVNSTVRGDMYLTEPAWSRVLFPWRFFCPELFDWINRSSLSDWRRRTSRDAGDVNATSNSLKSD